MTLQQQSAPSDKQRGAAKFERIPIKIVQTTTPLKKPDWIRVTLPNAPSQVAQINEIIRLVDAYHLHTVCKEASCPNWSECFSHGTATFMIMGDKCTRRCSFCDVAHGRPDPLDPNEPINLAKALEQMQLRHVVITSVDRDDLRDGGAGHFVACIREIRKRNAKMIIEILVPDFRGRMQVALDIMAQALPDIFNHNIETVPRLYKQARPGSDYQFSLDLLKNFKLAYSHIPTKSGIMLGLGETMDEVEQAMQDLRHHQVDMITIGQYLAPSRHHLPVMNYVTPDEFKRLAILAKEMGFSRVASGPLVRSSYHADQQAAGEDVS
jgi:lipoic acid synthetase